MKKILAFTLFIGLVYCASFAQGRLTPELLWKFGRVSDAQLSPDGKTVVYGISRYDASTNKSNTDIYSVSTDGGTPKQLTNFEGPEFNQRWTKDGSRIGFLGVKSGVVKLFEMNPDGSDKKLVSNITGSINSFEYSPTGDKILYVKDVKLDQTASEVHPDLPLVDVRIIDDLMYRHWNQWHDYAYSHIFVADYKDAKVNDGKDIMENEKWDAPLSPYFDNTEMTWSPDGKIIAYTCKKLKGRDYAISTNSDIYLYYVETGKTTNMTEGMMGYDKYPIFSPDSKNVAWLSMETPGFEADKDRLFIYDLETKKKEYYTESFDQNVASVTWSDDAKTIYFLSGIKATEQIFKIDLKTKEITQITKGVHNYFSYSISGDVIIGQKMSMSMATEIFKINEKDGTEKQITFTNKDIYDKIKMGKVEERWVKTTDGKDMLVWVIYPPYFDANKKYPALLYCQGGPQSAVSQFFSYRWNFQMMAANDYIVVAPNRRGLPSFGTEWNNQISKDWGGQNMKDYLSAIDALKTEPFIDENRLGAVGASYGGFSVYWLAGNHDKRFKAFISHCGMFNMESFYGTTEESFFVNYDIGGPYWENPQPKSYSTSPHKYVQNWDTPIMVITGGNDMRVPYSESIQAFNVAQLKGIPSKLLFFPEETHFVLKPQNSILWQREFFKWFDQWLK